MIQIIENNTLHNIDVTMAVLTKALDNFYKEQQRQRDKAKKTYWAKRAKIDELEKTIQDANIPPVPTSQGASA